MIAPSSLIAAVASTGSAVTVMFRTEDDMPNPAAKGKAKVWHKVANVEAGLWQITCKRTYTDAQIATMLPLEGVTDKARIKGIKESRANKADHHTFSIRPLNGIESTGFYIDHFQMPGVTGQGSDNLMLCFALLRAGKKLDDAVGTTVKVSEARNLLAMLIESKLITLENIDEARKALAVLDVEAFKDGATDEGKAARQDFYRRHVLTV